MEKYQQRLSFSKSNQNSLIKRGQSRLLTFQIQPTKQQDLQEEQHIQPSVNPMLLHNQYNKKTRPSLLLTKNQNKENEISQKNVDLNLEKEQKIIKLDDKYKNHPYINLVSESVDKESFKKFVNMLYKGITYSEKFLKGPSEKYLSSKLVSLPEHKQYRKKFLILDLDETLIHSIQTYEKCDVVLTLPNTDTICFNVRPYCFEFLQKMNQHFAIYIFTASTISYATPIIQYLNKRLKTIQGFLTRINCMETRNGFFIKDLRIIKNRQLKDIIMIDNLAHSFGLQLDNGIPILDFKNNTRDKQLLHIQKSILQLKDVEDVRPYIQSKFNLKKIVQMDQKDLNF